MALNDIQDVPNPNPKNLTLEAAEHKMTRTDKSLAWVPQIPQYRVQNGRLPKIEGNGEN